MGLMIHYRGRLDDVEVLPRLRDELTDVADSMGWGWTVLDEDWSVPPKAQLVHDSDGARIEGHLGLRGIVINPGNGCESIDLFFDAEGNLRSPMGIVMITEGTLKPEESWISVKTQFAGPDMHIWIVGLLKYLKRKYISNLEVIDEGKYWETGDRDTLEKKMKAINDALDYLEGELSSERFSGMSGLSAEEIASLIEQIFKERHENP